MDGVDSFCAGLIDGINTIQASGEKRKPAQAVIGRPRLQLESTRRQLQLLAVDQVLDRGRTLPLSGVYRVDTLPEEPTTAPRLAHARARVAKTQAGISSYLGRR